MADSKQDKAERPDAEAPRPAGRKVLTFVGGLAGLLVLAYVGALMAIPDAPDKVPRFAGPFVAPLSESNTNVNLSDKGGKRFLVMQLMAEYDAYEETYLQTRIADNLFKAQLQDALIEISGQKTVDEVLDKVLVNVFMEEIRVAVDPIVFPVHVGIGPSPHARDPESGLGPGHSNGAATLREPFFEHRIHVDAAAGEIALDDGPAIPFEGTEDDLLLRNGAGKVVYVDVTRLDEDFKGDVYVGVRGRVRRIYRNSFLIQ